MIVILNLMYKRRSKKLLGGKRPPYPSKIAAHGCISGDLKYYWGGDRPPAPPKIVAYATLRFSDFDTFQCTIKYISTSVKQILSIT